MRETIKKVMSIVLVVSMILGSLYTFEIEKKEVYASDNIEDNVYTDNSITFSADNSAGELIADKLSESTEKQDNNGYNILAVTVKGTSAEVELESIDDAQIIVGIYSEDGQEMQGMGTADIKQSDRKVVININIDTMPQYFLVRAFLIDETMSPLCSKYESTMYTKEMQDFLSKTTDDFDKDKVLNFDSDKTNNFAVYKDGVNRISSGSSNKLVSYDDEKGEYRFSNVDSIIAQLKSGDIFAYDNNGTELIVKVNRIVINGTEAVIYSQETSLEEVFDYVKVDDSQDVGKAVVDTKDMQSGIVYKGMEDYADDVEPESGDENSYIAVLSGPAVDLEGKYDKEAAFDFNNTPIKCNDDNYVEISGGLKLAANASVKVYITLNYQYVEVKLDLSIKLNLALKENIGGTIKLAELGISPCPGLYIGFTPSIVIKASVKLEVSGKLESTVGFRYGSKNGFENISTNPTFSSKVDISGEIYLGISLEPKVTILSEKISKAWMKAETGVIIEAKADFDRGKEGEYTHDCVSCIDGSIYAKLNVSAGVKFLEKDNLSLTVELIKIEKLPIADFYYSETFKDGGWGKCKHYKYKVHCIIASDLENIMYNTLISVDGKQEYNTQTKASIDIYLSNGKHKLEFTKEGYNSTIREIDINGNIKNVYIIMIKKISDKDDNNKNDDNDYNLGDEYKFRKVVLGLYSTGAITKTGSLYMWGENLYGESEDGATLNSNKPLKIMDNIVDVGLGMGHYGVITEDGELYMWGENDVGQLGDGTNKNSKTPIKVMSDVVALSLGAKHTAAITADGSLYMWGYNNCGQLGTGTKDNSNVPLKIMDNVSVVSLRFCTSGIVTNTGDTYMFGQLSNETPTWIMKSKDLSIGAMANAAILGDGDLYTWGNNDFGQLGNGGTDKYITVPQKVIGNIDSVSAGMSYMGAITKNGNLYMWGQNLYGQLGDGTCESRNLPTLIMENVKNVCVSGDFGKNYSAAITKDGKLYMWGNNTYGQLGNGTYEKSTIPKQIILNEKNSRMKLEDFFIESDIKDSVKQNNIDMPEKIIKDLKPQKKYMIYIVKEDEKKELLSDDNLIYIDQKESDENGIIKYNCYNELLGNNNIMIIGSDREVEIDEKGSIIKGLKDNITLDSLQRIVYKRYIVLDGTYNTYKNDSDYIKTGDILCILDSKGNYSRVYSICIKGDVDGTGTIDVLDMEAIQKSILGIGDKLSGAYKEVASLTGGEDITVLDMEAIQKDILGIQKIN